MIKPLYVRRICQCETIVIYVTVKIVTPCFNRPSFLSRFLVGQCSYWKYNVNHKKSLMCKYSKLYGKKIPSWLVCGSCDACPDCMLSGVQKSHGFFCVQVVYAIVKIVTPCLAFLEKILLVGFLAGWQAGRIVKTSLIHNTTQHSITILSAFMHIQLISYTV